MHILVHVATFPEGKVFMGQFGTTQSAFPAPACRRQRHHQGKCFLRPLGPGLYAVQCKPTAMPQIKIQRLTSY